MSVIATTIPVDATTATGRRVRPVRTQPSAATAVNTIAVGPSQEIPMPGPQCHVSLRDHRSGVSRSPAATRPPSQR